MRTVDADLLAAIASGTWRPVLGVWLDWPGGEVRYHSRVGDIELDGETWQGVGELGGVEGLEEVEGLAVREIRLTLTGFLADQIAKVRGVKVRNRPAEIHLGAVDAGERQIGSLVRLIAGDMRAKSLKIRDANGAELDNSIEVIVRNHFDSVRRPVEVRTEHPRLAALRDQIITWPE